MVFIKPFTDTKERSNKFKQSFDKEKITIKMKGKKFNLYDYIQSGREDTEIYPTLEKYGNLQTMERPAEEIIADFSDAMDLRDLMEQENRVREIFDSLPATERNKFNNNFYEFKQNGLTYYQNIQNELIKKQQEILKQQQQQQTQQQTQQQGEKHEEK